MKQPVAVSALTNEDFVPQAFPAPPRSPKHPPLCATTNNSDFPNEILFSTELLPAAFSSLKKLDCVPPAPEDLAHGGVPQLLSLESDLALSTDSEKSLEKSPDVLELILSQSSLRLDLEDDLPEIKACPVAPDNRELRDSTQIEKDSNANTSTPQKTSLTTYHQAILQGFCKICNKPVTEDMELHINSHPPSKKRSKARAVLRKLKTESTQPNVNTPPARSDLEKTFREKFPELPIFNNSSSSSPDSSPDYDFLVAKLQAPTSGPPTITSFSRREYSLVVKKGLFRCEFCEKAFVLKLGIDSHYVKVHDIKPHRIQPKLFPGGRNDICHFCCHSPKGDQTLAEHYKHAHNLEVHSDRPYVTSTTIDISPTNFTSTQPKQRDLAANSSTIIVTPSSPQDIQIDKQTTNADIHSPPNSRPEDTSFRTCSECGFVANKTSGLKLHYFKIHKIRNIPKKKSTPPDFEEIETLPSLPSTSQKLENQTENPPIQDYQSKKNPPNSVEFHCFICKKKISKNPSKHTCLKGKLIIPKAMFSDDSEWTCPTCNDFSTNSKVGKQNHLASHKREQIRSQATPLLIPESSAQKKRRKRSKVVPLADGTPGDTRIAPPIASINQDLLKNDEKENDAPPSDDEDDNNLPKIDLPVPSVLSTFLDSLDALIEVDDVSNALETFENLMNGITTTVQDYFHLSPKRSSGDKNIPNRKAFDPMNAQEVQKLYKWNRRRCVRSIACPVSNRCPISKTSLYDHFLKTWGAPNQDYILQSGKCQERPPILDSLDPEFVLSCPVYKPVKTQLQAWKISNCVLIHKKDELDLIDNWHPIALSNTIYKLFMKCLTRKLQDWCEFNQVLCSAQKGFTPHDGVIEHNFLLAQSLKTAKRNKTDVFLAFLDISNAFGSIPHEVIFKVMEREGVDAEFSTMIENIYLGSHGRWSN
ncbi:retrovirus-related Pol polyprotein from type-1 retrotransposable element R2 [Nephila pilipes]|uniref:Retrovirus-related Pol polyprotein from type-1 retrotransposable element R2 n=1 Tax=Nephila pilipes TaxID=299642 RepID=A0A8X6I377_NEPPI|nr:retrovirus-related Pol polyprotein from type-1 retrotransposable element R2 [Nephila pilipes]